MHNAKHTDRAAYVVAMFPFVLVAPFVEHGTDMFENLYSLQSYTKRHSFVQVFKQFHQRRL